MPIKFKTTDLNSFINNCELLAKKVMQRRYDLVQMLSKYETHETANDEIERSLNTLLGMRKELKTINKPLQDLTISTFFPLNLPFYSLVLFGIAPSVFAQDVFVRPPEVMDETLRLLFKFLNIQSYFPNISLHALPRYIFMELYAAESDVTIFTGKYQNALAIQARCPHALLIYNGSGINPFVVFDDADISLTAEKAVEMRCFNSGQDCAGPDAFFVPSIVADLFVGKLQDLLDKIKVGDSRDSTVKISRTIKETYLRDVEKLLEQNVEHRVYGGDIDHENRYVYPAIIRKPLRTHSGDFHEFFAPVFYVLEYDNIKELEKMILSETFKKRTMYISVFGNNPKIEQKLKFATVIKNLIVNDIERGNRQYGGYGYESNFLLYGQQKTVQPLLISRDLHKILI